MIRTITFDFWNTISRWVNTMEWNARQLEKALTISGYDIPHEQILEATIEAWKRWDRIWIEEQRTTGAKEWLRHSLECLQAKLPPSQIIELEQLLSQADLHSNPPMIDGLANILPELAQDYQLAIISDTGLTPGKGLRQILQRYGILSYFDHFTFSDELGVSKPHPLTFLSTLEALSTPPAEAVHIGDSQRTDINGAKRVGMRAILFTGAYLNDEEISKYELVFPITAEGPAPDAIISSFFELPPLLRNWNNSRSGW